jgi:hypothetical protein
MSLVAAFLCLQQLAAEAHQGPPYPIVSEREVGAYTISIWSDPDTTDDHSAGAKFWILVRAAAGAVAPPDTGVGLAVRPHGSERPAIAVTAAREAAKSEQFFVAVEIDQEGPWDVEATVAGALGPATITTLVEATYDLRPPAATTLLYLLPFAAVGLIWLRAMVFRRRRGAGSMLGQSDRNAGRWSP